MKVDGLDIDVGVEGALVDENRATCVMGHVEAMREKLVVNILGRLLQGASSFPRRVVDAESPLHNRTGRKSVFWNFSCEKR